MCSHNVLEWRSVLGAGYGLHCANCGLALGARTDVPRSLQPFHPETTIRPAEAKPLDGGEESMKSWPGK